MIKSSFVYLFSSIFAKLSPFILLPILTNTLSNQDFSIGSLYISSIGFLSVFISFGTQTVIPKYYFSCEENEFSDICSNIIILIFIISCVLSLIILMSGVFFEINYYYYMILFSSFGLAINNLYLSYLRTTSKLLDYVMFEVSYTIFSFFSVFVLLKFLDTVSVIHWVGPICVINILFGFVSFLFLSKNIKCNYFYSKEIIKKIFKLCFPLIPHSISLIIINLSDRFILNYYLEPNAVANYILAANLVVVIKVVSDAFMKAWNPFYFKNVGKMELIKKYKIYFYGFYFLMCFIFYLVVNFVFYYIFSEEFDSTLTIIPILIFGYVIFIFYQLNVSVLIHVNFTSKLKVITPLAALINVLGNIIFIPKYGVMSAAYMTCVGYLVMAVLTSIIIRNMNENKSK